MAPHRPLDHHRCPHCGAPGFGGWGMCTSCGYDATHYQGGTPEEEDVHGALRDRRVTLLVLLVLMMTISLALFALHPLAFVVGLLLVLVLLVQLRSVLFQLRAVAEAEARGGGRPRARG